jgi:hypothetical protein
MALQPLVARRKRVATLPPIVPTRVGKRLRWQRRTQKGERQTQKGDASTNLDMVSMVARSVL